jgi:hypothetical protein
LFASGAIIYAYVGGNPVNAVDPLGLTDTHLPIDQLPWYDIFNPEPYHSLPFPKRTPEEKAAMDAEHKAYDAVCNHPPGETEDKCTNLLNRINYQRQCANLKEKWDKNWAHPDFPGGRHADEISVRRKNADKLQEQYEKECGKNCP